MLMAKRLSTPLLVSLSLAASLGTAARVRAELVILTDGQFFKVARFEADETEARLTFPKGGVMSMPIERVERVIDDEVVPQPDPPPQVAQAAPPPEAVPLA